MSLAEYFEKTQGRGILATADAAGKVDMAIYSKPHVMPDGTLAFIMAEHRTHQNIQANPKVCFLFMESGGWFAGVRLYLTKTRETDDPNLVSEICKTCSYHFHGDQLSPHIVFFKVDEERPLVGG